MTADDAGLGGGIDEIGTAVGPQAFMKVVRPQSIRSTQ